MMLMLTVAVAAAAVGSMFAGAYGVLLAPGEPDQRVSLRMRSAESGEIGQPPALQVTDTERTHMLDGAGVYRTGSSDLWIALREAMSSGIGCALWMLAAAAGPVLLIAWANTADPRRGAAAEAGRPRGARRRSRAHGDQADRARSSGATLASTRSSRRRTPPRSAREERSFPGPHRRTLSRPPPSAAGAVAERRPATTALPSAAASSAHRPAPE